MNALSLPKHASLFVLLLLFSVTQSACSLFRPADDPGRKSATGELASEREYQISGFRYEIPLPDDSSALRVTETRVETGDEHSDEQALPAGFRLQSFVETIFSGFGQPEPSSEPGGEKLALAKLPGSERPEIFSRSPEQTRFCEQIDQRLSSIQFDECMASRMELSGHYSSQGQPILRSEFKQIDSMKPTGRVLLIGGVHGDELSSVSIVFEWMQFLRQHHDGAFVWNIVPVMNPDGLFKSRPTRTNANGVDLNRNLPTSDWRSTALAYWENQANGSPRKFPGPGPASEAETRWLIDEIDRFQPDMIITVHAPHNLIDYDAPSRTNAPRRFGDLKGNRLGTYPGSLGNYAGVRRGIPVVTIELPSANIATSVTQAQYMWSDMLEWLEKTIPLENQRFLKNRDGLKVKTS